MLLLRISCIYLSLVQFSDSFIHPNCRRLMWSHATRFASVPTKETSTVADSSSNDAENIALLTELIVKKIEEGKLDELKAAGMKVSNLSDRQQSTATEIDTPPFAESDEDLDVDLINTLMSDDNIELDEKKVESALNQAKESWFDENNIDKYREQLLSSSRSDIAKRVLLPSSPPQTPSQYVPIVFDDSQPGGEAPSFVESLNDLPPTQSRPTITQQNMKTITGSLGEMQDDLYVENDEDDMDGEDLAQLADEVQAAVLGDISNASSKTASKQLSKVENNEDEDRLQREINSATFAELLKASLEDTTEKTSAESLAAITTEDMQAGKKLDLRSFIGGPLFSIAEAMNINVEDEIKSSSAIQKELMKLFQGNAAELDQNIVNLNEQSDKLMEQLSTLQFELKEEENKFEATKTDELDSLFSQQAAAQAELMRSREDFEKKAIRLQELIRSVNENADFMTYLVMFPLKPNDQKLVFVLGLSMTLKTMFDLIFARLMQLPDFALDVSDPEDLVKIGVQLAIVAVSFTFSGVWRAIFNTFLGKSSIPAEDKKDVL